MQFLPKLNADTYKTLIYGFKNQNNQFPWWVEKKSEFGSVCWVDVLNLSLFQLNTQLKVETNSPWLEKSNVQNVFERL